ncbi:MAG: hypothetical protein AVDCRST_MAG86-1118 [uncultured Truepera sp.]|uniref:Uncharacterized protein n=1 Tax=uncultured Truepera sp. TaxID=543023 RepID=A0A6J4V569_9DEIN|nr:MAG: hypothetical protein AVDCRST_MAG86-1118 [uncultured Truepera sp.]
MPISLELTAGSRPFDTTATFSPFKKHPTSQDGNLDEGGADPLLETTF